MAISIGLVAGTGSVTLQHGTGEIKNYASDNLKYDINGKTINFYQLQPYVWLGSETIILLENLVPAAIGNEAAVRAYLDVFIGASKAL